MLLIFENISVYVVNCPKTKNKENFTLLTINAPADFKKNIGELPKGVKISEDSKNYNQVHWFVMNKAQMDKELTKVLKLIKDESHTLDLLSKRNIEIADRSYQG